VIRINNDDGYFVEVDIDKIIEGQCKEPKFKRGYEKVKERHGKTNSKKKRYNSMDRARKMKK